MPDAFDATARLNRRLANLRADDGYHLGVEFEAGIVDLTAAAGALAMPAPRDMDDLLQNGSGTQVAAVVEALSEDAETRAAHRVGTVRFAPLVTRPEKIICVGFNYREHAAETGTPIPKEPPVFSKYANALNHHGGRIVLPTLLDDRFDYETELVIVIGRAGRDIPEAAALDHVAGYAVGNDVSARTRQTATSQFGAGKWSDGFAPLGPWLVPAGQVPDPNALRLRTFVNGEVRQDWTTRDMIFDCRKLVAHCSRLLTLKPGDVIFTGTPQGVILGETAPPEERRWLRVGDTGLSTIEGLGELQVTLV